MKGYRDTTSVFKVVDMEAAAYWARHGFRICGGRLFSDGCVMERECSFAVEATFLDKLAVISMNGHKGIANFHGDIILPCIYDKVEIATTENAQKVCDIHFICHRNRNVEIFEFDGEKATALMKLETCRLKSMDVRV